MVGLGARYTITIKIRHTFIKNKVPHEYIKSLKCLNISTNIILFRLKTTIQLKCQAVI